MLDGRRLLKLDESRYGGGRLMVLRDERRDVVAGLLVDTVRGVEVIDANALTPALADPVAGAATVDGQQVYVVDLERLLRAQELTGAAA